MAKSTVCGVPFHILLLEDADSVFACSSIELFLYQNKVMTIKTILEQSVQPHKDMA